jgi:beta-lactam-binding protein with PASTA domain
VPALNPENIASAFEDLLRGGPARKVTVPETVGLRVSEASRLLGRAGLRIVTRTSMASPPTEGVVARQSVQAGSRVRRGSTLTLDLAFPSVDPTSGSS